MFSAMKRALVALVVMVVEPVAARVRVPQEAVLAEQRRVVLALARQAQAAATVRQLALVADLAPRLLPAPRAQVVLAAVAVRLVELPVVPALPGVRRKSRSRRSSSSRARTGRSTTRRRR